jgi:hypothetical protein
MTARGKLKSCWIELCIGAFTGILSMVPVSGNLILRAAVVRFIPMLRLKPQSITILPAFNIITEGNRYWYKC